MHKITVRQTEAARRAALLAGQPAEYIRTYTLDSAQLPTLLSLPWTKVTPDGVATCVVPDDANHPVPDASAALEWARAVAEREAAARAEREAEDRAAAAAWAALPLEWRVDGCAVAYCRPTDAHADYRGPLKAAGRRVVSLDALARYAPAALAEAEAEAARQRQAREAEAARQRAAREADALAEIEAAKPETAAHLRALIADGFEDQAWRMAQEALLRLRRPDGYLPVLDAVMGAKSYTTDQRLRIPPRELAALREARAALAGRPGLGAPELVYVRWYAGTHDTPVDEDTLVASDPAILVRVTAPSLGGHHERSAICVRVLR